MPACKRRANFAPGGEKRLDRDRFVLPASQHRLHTACGGREQFTLHRVTWFEQNGLGRLIPKCLVRRHRWPVLARHECMLVDGHNDSVLYKNQVQDVVDARSGRDERIESDQEPHFARRNGPNDGGARHRRRVYRESVLRWDFREDQLEHGDFAMVLIGKLRGRLLADNIE